MQIEIINISATDRVVEVKIKKSHARCRENMFSFRTAKKKRIIRIT